MSNEPSTQPSAPTLRDLTHDIARRLNNGQSRAALVQRLVDRGWPEPSAAQFVANAARIAPVYAEQVRRQIARNQYYKNRIMRGALGAAAGASFIAVSLILPNTSLGLIHFAVGVALCLLAPRDLAAGARAWLNERRKR